jgi:phytoene desaturase
VRQVTGPTGRIVVVGAGLGGLSAALQLAGAGREVIVCERGMAPGGCAGALEIDGYRFDTGPTVLTMPELINDALAAVDESLEDWLDLRRLDPAYRAWFPDGSHLDVTADLDAMTAQLRDSCGPGDAAGYERFVHYARRLYELQMNDFIDRNFDSPLDLVGGAFAKLVAAGGFARLGPRVGSFVRDPRLRRILSFQAMYAGVSPREALALYSVITYMDTVAGVWFPAGGMHEVPRALAGAADKHGVTFRYGADVVDVEMRGGRAVAVRTRDGERIETDAVVLNTDPQAAARMLGAQPAARTFRRSPSCVLMLVGARTSYSQVAHHNLHFGAAWRATFDEVIRRGELMSDPSLLVSVPSTTDPSLAPRGGSSMYVLAPAPNLETSSIDWLSTGPRYRDELLARMEHLGYTGLSDAADVVDVITPADWARQGHVAGTPFSLAHTFGQTGPFRPGNLVADNVVLAGAGTRPGVGVPMVLVSGRLAAERILGPAR